jgi:hypothetical protein
MLQDRLIKLIRPLDKKFLLAFSSSTTVSSVA